MALDCGRSIAEVRDLLDSVDNAAFDRGEYTSEQWHALLSERLGIRMGLDELRKASALAFTPDYDMLRLVDAIRRHARTALFTNNPSLLHEAMPSELPEIVERFDPLIFTYQLGYTKPATEAFDGAIARLGEPPQQIVFIDDSPASVEAGSRAGMHAVRFESAAQLRTDLERLTGWQLG